MAEEKQKKENTRLVKVHTGGGALYGLGIIGVAVYYIQHAMTFWMVVFGIVKAIFWPAIIIYKVFEMLHL